MITARPQFSRQLPTVSAKCASSKPPAVRLLRQQSVEDNELSRHVQETIESRSLA